MRPFLLSLAVPLCSCALNPPERTPLMPKSALEDPRVSSHRKVRIELLALDLESCGRCTRTDRNLEAALRTAASRLREKNIDVGVSRHVVTSEAQAKRLRFSSSPTIRIDGRDIALELRESPCDDCGELCGCEGGVSCRVWVWKGREHLEAPTEMIVEAILEAVDSPPSKKESPVPYHMPENLRTFFAALSQREEANAEPGESRRLCCGPATSSECCGTSP
jgi:hypothetical protein